MGVSSNQVTLSRDTCFTRGHMTRLWVHILKKFSLNIVADVNIGYGAPNRYRFWHCVTSLHRSALKLFNSLLNLVMLQGILQKKAIPELFPITLI